MENNERDRKLDQWLDEALSQYSAAEPRLGLEQRVLASVRAEERAQTGRRSWWRWMPAFAAIAAVLIVMVAVRPYWEQKEAPKQLAKETIATYSAPSPNAAPTAEAPTPKSFALAKDGADVVDRVSRAKQEAAAPEKRPMLSKDTNLDERREAEVQPKMAAVPASRAYRDANDLAADKKAVAKESDPPAVQSKALPVQNRSYESVIVAATPAAPPAAKPDSGRTAVGLNAATGGAITRQVQRADGAQSVASQAETVEVQPAAQNSLRVEQPKSEPQPVAGGIVGTGKTSLADASANAKTVTAKSRGALAKKAKENSGTEILGLGVLKTELQHVPAGPTQQFPTPAPLSEEEKLMLAAGKQLKGKPANEETGQKTDGDTNAIEIKKIEIAPLPGPPK